ncbi:helix-turn-helix transcriptional regulator [Streptomyces hirsutus]|uniref:helix-turn-helix domain-containing protein n=1 Tax=Streptomyces hirsutus TaxID=35620 RepID=UPI00343A06EF
MASLNVGNLGDYLREQRRNAQLSLRQLADAAGVSNPYLSQIERGLRKPSAEVLQQVAKALRISAETLYVRAGILDAERDRDDVETRAVILADLTLTERQKQVLLQIYESFRKENGFVGPEDGETTGSAGGVDTVDAVASVDVDAVASVDVDVVGVVGGAGAAQGAEVPEAAEAAEASDVTDGSGGGAGIRRGRQGGGGSSAKRRTPSRSKGGTSAERRPRKAGGTDTDPQRTAD